MRVLLLVLLAGCVEATTGLPCASDEHCRAGEVCDDGVRAVDPGAAPWAFISSGGDHVCGLRADELACWGRDHHGQASPPEGAWTAVQSGSQFACALADDGAVSCWGRPLEGRLATPDGAWDALAVGSAHGCVLRDGTVACWGRAGEGQTEPPTASFDAIDAYGVESCGTVGGDLVCWGATLWGQELPTGVESFAVGPDYVCWLEEGQPACVGGGFTEWLEPPAVTLSSLDAGESFACGVRTDGRVHCWAASAPTDWSPVELAGIESAAAQVTVGARHGCARFEDGTVACFGDTSDGQALVP